MGFQRLEIMYLVLFRSITIKLFLLVSAISCLNSYFLPMLLLIVPINISQGSPSESGFYLDAQASFQFVESRDDLNSSNVILFGRSLGNFFFQLHFIFLNTVLSQ